jgi:signal transduction histidine kinase
MDVRTTPSSPQFDAPRARRVVIDQPELRSVLSNLSHELRRPLVSLRAGFDLLLGELPATLTQDQRDHLLTMAALCDDLLRLTRSYLDYASLVQGSRPLCLGSFTIGALIHEIDRQFAPVAGAGRVQWETHIELPETLVITDASRCQQILGNLVSNALKYTPMGGRVEVLSKPEADSWSVTISDSGPGIPADALDQVFEPFFRLPRDEHSRIEGSGLGLSICQELVTQLHGEIVLNSDVGLGTSVRVCFPLVPPGMPRSSALATGSSSPTLDQASVKRTTGTTRSRTPDRSSRSTHPSRVFG